MVIYEIKNLSFAYPDEHEKTLQNVNFKINSGDFVLLCGKSGSGKSTLLSQMKKETIKKGIKTGSVLFCNQDIENTNDFDSVSKIGFCAQNPALQQICETVENELQFILTNLDYDTKEINIKIAETVSFFGIENLFHKKIAELSGGERQIINIAAAVVAEPKVLLLDEPFSQLDLFSCERLSALLKKLNQELGITIVIAEHNLEKILEFCTVVIYIENKNALEFSLSEFKKSEFIKDFGIIPYEVYNCISKENNKNIVTTVLQCKNEMERYNISYKSENNLIESLENICVLKDVCFRYKKNSPNVLDGVSLNIKKGEVFSVLGCNGSGKTTLTSIINGVNKPFSGKIKISRDIKISVIPQDPTLLFCFDTVVQILNNCGKDFGYKELFKEMNNLHPEKNTTPDVEVYNIAKQLNITDILYKNTFDLSVGQQQITAFAYIMLSNPDLIILDEPTKGIDKQRKDSLTDFIINMKKQSKTIIIVTHDIDFSAEVSDRCALLFDGKIVTQDNTDTFLKNSRNYTSAVNRIFSSVDYSKRPVSLKEVKKCSAELK